MRTLLTVVLFGCLLCLVQCSQENRPSSDAKQKIAFMSTRDGNYEIYLMDANGENAENLTNNPATDFSFAWSPDGKRLLFYSDREGNDEIFVLDIDTKAAINLTNHPGSDRLHAWSADGHKIAFTSDRDHKDGELYLMNADGSEVTRITNNDVYEDALSFGPDGRIYFTRMINEDGEQDGEIFSVNPDGTDEKRITFRKGFDSGVTWSPDGQWIAFYGPDSTGNSEIFLMDRDGNNIEAITLDTLADYSPSWSADSQWIAYTSGNKSNYDVWLISVSNREKRRLTTQPKRDESPLWQPVNH